jgi:hypothetical protein
VARPQFQLWAGKDDTITPDELYYLINQYKLKHRLKTKYAALAEMLKKHKL